MMVLLLEEYLFRHRLRFQSFVFWIINRLSFYMTFLSPAALVRMRSLAASIMSHQYTKVNFVYHDRSTSSCRPMSLFSLYTASASNPRQFHHQKLETPV